MKYQRIESGRKYKKGDVYYHQNYSILSIIGKNCYIKIVNQETEIHKTKISWIEGDIVAPYEITFRKASNSNSQRNSRQT